MPVSVEGPCIWPLINPLINILKQIIKRSWAFLMIIATKGIYSARVLVSKVTVWFGCVSFWETAWLLGHRLQYRVVFLIAYMLRCLRSPYPVHTRTQEYIYIAINFWHWSWAAWTVNAYWTEGTCILRHLEPSACCTITVNTRYNKKPGTYVLFSKSAWLLTVLLFFFSFLFLFFSCL